MFERATIGVAAACLFTLLVVGAGIHDSLTAENRWRQFRANHDCRSVPAPAGDIRTFGAHGWRCDDGRVYWRPESWN